MKRSRFHQISITLGVVLLSFVVSNLAARDDILGVHSLPEILVELVNLVYLGFGITLLTTGFLRETKLTRLIQIHIIVALGTMIVLFVTPREIGPELLFLIAASLAYKYQLLRSRPVPKLIVIMGPLILARIYLAIFDESVSVDRAINQLLIGLAGIPLLYWLFEEELLRIEKQRDRLQELQENNQAFVEFGRNVSGVVHDFKNDLGLFANFAQIMRLGIGEELTEHTIKMYDGYVARFSRRIDQLRMVTSYSQRQARAIIDLVSTTRATLYVFEANLNYKRVVRFSFVSNVESVRVDMAPAPFVSILENLIENSCEALVEDSTAREHPPEHRPLIAVTLDATEAGVQIVITDNGPGIPHCGACTGDNCLYCPKFQIGSSSKKDGSGIGMFNIRRAVERLGISLMLTSTPGVGVRAEITIPRDYLTVQDTNSGATEHIPQETVDA